MDSCMDLAEARGFPIRKSSDQSLFAAPRSLSQRTTSFIASQHQGIHKMPLSRLIVLIINAHPRCPGAGSRQALERMVIEERLVDCARFACCGRSSATAAARGKYRQIFFFTMSMSITHRIERANSIRSAGRISGTFMTGGGA
jgi:hypothetical protein